jgi:hypothetical protein
VAFDPVAAADCIHALSTVRSTCDEPAPQEWEPCTRVYVGYVSLAASCEASIECAGSEFGQAECSRESGWTCVPSEVRTGPLPGLGARCDGFCAEGAYCPDFRCVAQVVTGSCADSPQACVAGSYCDDATRVCIPKAADGQACEYGMHCSSGACDEGVCGPFHVASQTACSGEDPDRPL